MWNSKIIKTQKFHTFLRDWHDKWRSENTCKTATSASRQAAPPSESRLSLRRLHKVLRLHLRGKQMRQDLFRASAVPPGVRTVIIVTPCAISIICIKIVGVWWAAKKKTVALRSQSRPLGDPSPSSAGMSQTRWKEGLRALGSASMTLTGDVDVVDDGQDLWAL